MRYGMDVIVYLIMALIGTVFFVLHLLIALFFGGDGDIGGDLADTGGDVAFSLFSILSILAFYMGAGWMGLTCRVDWELSSMVAALAATGFGFALMFMASGMMVFARKLSRTVEYDHATAVGTRKVLEAKSAGYQRLLEICEDRKDIAPALLLIEQLPTLVAEQVKAIQNLKIDKIILWDHAGNSSDTSSSTAGFLRGMIAALPPIHDLAKQAGIELPAAFGKVEDVGESTPPAPGQAKDKPPGREGSGPRSSAS